jgi:Amt family ammonium transporter
MTYVIFKLLKKTTGIRVSKMEEIIGLDLTEHDITAYSGMASNEGD